MRGPVSDAAAAPWHLWFGNRLKFCGAFAGGVGGDQGPLAPPARRRLPLSAPLLACHLARARSMQFMLLFSRQGKLRLQKWYVPLSDKEKKKITRELVQTVLARKPKMCSFLEWRDLKIVYKRYASLYFCCAIEDQDNELITLEIIHRYVELLDKYFGSVCELDIIFNFEKAYFILDEFLLGGEVQETSKKNVLKAIEQADLLQESLFPNLKLPNATYSETRDLQYVNGEEVTKKIKNL
ncbi:hypothetical protein EI555_015832 [Monodon monoceros]|uniref:AP-1 complex subunit sigma-2 n=1 Tax=Monodon monoceros TaxID=40151 RepID=A0A4U1EQ73_MONMO|nr:hypothetical protein EI555_015832 [Monodon monoceros]